MGIKKWAKRKAAILSIALANVESDVLGQKSTTAGGEVSQVRDITQGTLMDNLLKGEVTQAVKELRWRTYKVMQAASDLKATIIGYEPDGTPIYKLRKLDKEAGLELITVEPSDSYGIELVLDNDDITLSVLDVLDRVTIAENANKVVSEHDGIEVKKHGDITNDNLASMTKPTKPLVIGREFFPKFKIENYTKKLHVRTIDKTNKLLEFYVSKYPDEDNRRTTLFLKELEKCKANEKSSNMLEILEVGFVTYGTIGADDFMEYKYKINSLDKIVEFNGHYVIKFLAEVIIDGFDTVEKYRETELDAKYEKKERKKQ